MKLHENSVGISGASIEFSDKYVKKIGTPRLILQARKQHQFNKYKNTSFKAPRINRIGENFFEMDRVKGVDWYDFFIYSKTSEIHKFSRALIEYLSFFKQGSRWSDQKWNIEKKLKSLIPASQFVYNYSPCIKGGVYPLVPKSFCHGDLTLSNMVFAEEVYLIDFLDSFIDSYWIDIIKLRQDLLYKWSLNYYNIKSTKCLSIFNYLNNELSAAFQEDIDKETFRILECINILRIEPYTDRKDLLKAMLDQGEYLEKFNSSRSGQIDAVSGYAAKIPVNASRTWGFYGNSCHFGARSFFFR